MKCLAFPPNRLPTPASRAALLLLALGLGLSSHAADSSNRMIAVTQLQARGVSSSDAAVLTESLSDEMVQSGSVRVMERSQMDKILSEQGFQATACDTNECALQMGRMLGIERILVGTVGKIGGTYSVSVRMVDVNTGEIIASSRRNAKGAIDDVLVTLMPLLARDLTGRSEAQNSGENSEAKVEEKKSSALWWTLGGIAVVGGGATAAYLLLAEGKSTSPNPDPGPESTNLVDVQVVAP